MANITIFSSSSRAAGTHNSDRQSAPFKARGVKLYLDITAKSGTLTLDVKVQGYDSVSDKYYDITGASFAQKSGTGSDDLTIYPGIAAVNNRSVNLPLPTDWRVVATVGGSTPTATFTVGAAYLL